MPRYDVSRAGSREPARRAECGVRKRRRREAGITLDQSESHPIEAEVRDQRTKLARLRVANEKQAE